MTTVSATINELLIMLTSKQYMYLLCRMLTHPVYKKSIENALIRKNVFLMKKYLKSKIIKTKKEWRIYHELPFYSLHMYTDINNKLKTTCIANKSKITWKYN